MLLFQGNGLIFMIQIKKDDTPVRHQITMVALTNQFFSFFAAYLAPMVNDPIVAAAYIFFKPAMVFSMHYAISIGRIFQKSSYNFTNTFIGGRIFLPDFR